MRTEQTNEEIITILSAIKWGTPIHRIVKLYLLMSLIRNKSSRKNTVKDTKISLRTLYTRIDDMRFEKLDYEELINKNDTEVRKK